MSERKGFSVARSLKVLTLAYLTVTILRVWKILRTGFIEDWEWYTDE